MRGVGLFVSKGEDKGVRTMEDRVAQLERQNYFLVIAFPIMATMIAVALATACTAAGDNTTALFDTTEIQAERIILVDSEGTKKAELGTREIDQFASLAMYGSDGEALIRIDASDIPTVRVGSPSEASVSMSLSVLGSPVFLLSGAETGSAVALTVAGGVPRMHLLNEDGSLVAVLTAEDNHGLLNIYDRYGEERRSYSFR